MISSEDVILKECEEGKARLTLLLAKLEGQKEESQTEIAAQSSGDYSKAPSAMEVSSDAK
ncbi:MAG: hypothetical protein JRN52_10875 [Nitrososphaerota archaeon]|nr:hypothetical protein [Nitrososphaerota archaeon]